MAYTATLGTSGTTAAFASDVVVIPSVTTAHYPNIKMVWGASSTGTPVCDATPMPASLSASTTQIGRVGGLSNNVDVSPVLSAPGTYVAGDYLGANLSCMEFSGAARTSGGTGVIGSAVLIDYNKQSASKELWLFDQPVTPQTDNLAFTLSTTDAAHCIGVIPFSTYYATTALSVSPIASVNLWFKCDTTATSIYGCGVSRTTAAHTTNGLTYRLVTSQD